MAFKRKEYHKEENCLNCAYPLVGKFCGNCGQKAFLHKDSFFHMVVHFVGDYFHYDNKFWRTLKTLFTKPGMVTLEYNQGKRAKYIYPIQLYFFVTTVYFLVVFSFSKDEEKPPVVLNSGNSKQEINDTALVKKKLNFNTMNFGEKEVSVNYDLNGKVFTATNIRHYDSIQKLLPSNKRDNLLKNYFRKKSFAYTAKYTEPDSFSKPFIEKVQHNIPKIFFALLPFFALLIAMVNYRKKEYYIDHLIFSIHFHCMLFVVLLFDSLVGLLNISINFETTVTLISMVGLGVYFFLSFKKVYPSSSLRVFIKQFVLLIGYFFGFLIAILFLLFFVFIGM